MDHIFLEDHNATYDDFSILIPESNEFKILSITFLSITDILMVLLIFVLKGFLVNFIFFIVSTLFSHVLVSLETRNRKKSCIGNQLPFCSLRIAFRSKTHLSSLFKFKDSIFKDLRSYFIQKFSCNCCKATYYGENETLFCTRVGTSWNYSTDTEVG